MAEITKMSIQGIRAFSPYELQSIKFQKPLTIIVGNNGCGKTTIIECLKLACTGELPPNINSGQSFVNDPSLSHQREVKGQVRLEFIDQNGKRYLCIRSYSLSVISGKLMFKTLDQTICIKNDLNSTESMSNRKRDIDGLIPQMLGISKSIIENVIFCHQDEANWPLLDSRELKKRFDSIFESTNYTKALEEVRDVRKKRTVELRQYEQEEIDKKNRFNQARKIRQEIVQLEREINENQITLSGIKEALSSQIEKKKVMDEEKCRYDTITHTIRMLQKEVEYTKQHYETTKSNIGEILTLCMDEMTTELRRIEESSELSTEELTRMETRRGILEKKMNDSKNRLKQLGNEEVSCRVLLSEAHRRLLLSIQQIISLLSSIPPYSLSSTTLENLESLKNLCSQFGTSAVNQESSLIDATTWESLLKLLNAIEDGFKSSLDAMDGKAKKMKEEYDRIVEEKNEKEMEKRMRLESIKLEIRSREERLESSQSLVKSKEEALKRIQRMEEEDSIIKLKQEKSEIELGIERQEQEINGIRIDTVTSIQMKEELRTQEKLLYDIRSELRVMESTKNGGNEGEKMKERLVGKVAEAMMDCGIECEKSEEGIKRKIDEVKNNLECLNRDKNELDKGMIEIMKKSSKEDGKKEALEEASNARDGIVTILKKEIEEEYKRQGIAFADNEESLAEAISKIMTMGQMNLTYNMLTAVEKHYHLLQLIEERVMDNSRLSLLVQAIRKNNQSMKAKEVMMSMTEKKYIELNGIMEWYRVYELFCGCSDHARSEDSGYGDIEELKERVNEEERKYQEMEKKVNEEERRIKKQEEEVSRRKEEVMRMKNRVIEICKSINDGESSQQKKYDLQRGIEEARKEMSSIREEIEHHRQLYLIANTTVEDGSANRQNVASQALKEAEAIHMKLFTISQQLMMCMGEIRRSPLLSQQSRVRSIHDDVTTIQQQYDHVASEMKELDLSLASLHSQTDRITLRKNVLRMNIELQKEKETIDQKNRKLTELQGQIISVDISEMERELESLQTSLENHKKQCNLMEGGINQLIRRRNQCSLELSSEYSSIDQEYVVVQTWVRLMKLVIEDLEKYERGIEEAILQYHQTKIKEINERIADLWGVTYKGEDIEKIELESKAEQHKSKGHFVYSVNMIKNRNRLEMRSRCSAGQKALASLVIRMALADTFCCKCGILALDEPTTNLDQDNKVALVESLKEIIHHRSRQQNFQLIIITHDEEFGQLLTQAELGDRSCYYRVSREGSHHMHGMYVSTITRKRWSSTWQYLLNKLS